MNVIGVTGGLACGKSAAAGILKKRGAEVFDADLAAKRAVRVGAPAYQAIVKIFGKACLNQDRTLNRRRVAEQVFSHPSQLKKLNTLIHPEVILECFKAIERGRKKKGILVIDAPLLYESKMENLTDFTIVIDADIKNILLRTKRDGLSGDLAGKIIASQWPLSRKSRRADFVIKNNGTLKQLEEKIWEVLELIKIKSK